jgi:Tfp pilus assembly protein PilF
MSPKTTILSLLCATLLGGCAATAVNTPAASLPPRDALALRLRMAETLVAQRDYDAALPYLRDLLRQEPKVARLHFLIGVVLRQKGIYGPAQRELEESLSLDPRSSESHAALASLFGRTHRVGLAEKHLRQAIKLAPGHAPHHNDLGVCLLMQRRYKDARTSLEEAIRIDPGLRVAFNNLGFVYAMEEDDEAMVRAFEQGGGKAMALTNLGFVEQLRGRPASARRYYEQALRAQRGYAPALRNLRALETGVVPAAPAHDDGPNHDEEVLP